MQNQTTKRKISFQERLNIADELASLCKKARRIKVKSFYKYDLTARCRIGDFTLMVRGNPSNIVKKFNERYLNFLSLVN